VKLRLLDDHLRLRLERDEVDRLGAGGTVIALTRFPNGTALGCALRTYGAEPSIRFDGGTITVDVPLAIARTWARDDGQVSIERELAGVAGPFTLLIEKDFECLEPRPGEDQRNRFPNPKARPG
jgi:hypothetical protein